MKVFAVTQSIHFNYYPFGMVMPERKFNAGSGYRYGFNGKENDKEISEGGQDYGMRIYDTRLGRFLSVDPLSSSYPWYTPYQFAGNSPIESIDLDGCEPVRSTGGRTLSRAPGARPNEEPGFEDWRAAGYKDPESYQRAFEAAGRRLRYEEKVKEERETEAKALRDPVFRRFYNNLQTWARNSFEIAPSVFGESPTTAYKQIHINRGNGNVFEKAIGEALVKNPNYQAVANQVTLVIEGTIKNGSVMTARIRVDFIGIKDNGLSLDLYEAKYSITEIKIDNVTRTLTEQQGKLHNIMQFDNTLAVYVRGDKLKEFGLPSGTDIIANIKSAQIVVPEGNATSGTTNQSTNSGSTNSVPATSKTKKNPGSGL